MGFYPKPKPPSPERRQLPEGLRSVNPEILKEYLEAVAVSVAERLRPGIPVDVVREVAAAAAQDPSLAGPPPDLVLTFSHTCRFVGCVSQTCSLCKHNPNKRCASTDNFGQTFLEKQALRTRCDAPIEVQLHNQANGQPFKLAGLEVQLSVIDGHAYNEAAPTPSATVVKLLLHSDKGIPLLGCDGNGCKVLPDGHVIMDLQEGRALLPSSLHVRVTSHVLKTKSFRLLAVAVRRNEQGQCVVDSKIKPAVSARFEVKSNRAATKSAYPHDSEPFTSVKYMGIGSYKALKDVRACLGPNVPFVSVQTVGELKALIQYADHHTEVENALTELFRFKGEHRERWGELRSVLNQVVLDDNTPRVYYSEDGRSGMLFPCKQGQVSFAKPMALVQQVEEGGGTRTEVVPLETSHQTAHAMRLEAEAAWRTPGHKGWQMFTEPIGAAASAPINMPAAGSGSYSAAHPLHNSLGSGSYGGALGGCSPPAAGLRMSGGLQHESSDLSNGSGRGDMHGAGSVEAMPRQPFVGFVPNEPQTPLAAPHLAALYPPMPACDGSFGFHAAQAVYVPAQVVNWGEELQISELRGIFDDDGPADMSDWHPDLPAELNRDLEQDDSTLGAVHTAQGLRHAQQQQQNQQQQQQQQRGFAGMEGLQHGDTGGMLREHLASFLGVNGMQHGGAGTASEQDLQAFADMNGHSAHGAIMGTSFKRSRGVGAEEDANAAVGERPPAGRALYHSQSRGRDLRGRFDSDNASLMSESSATLSDLQSEEELEAAMAAAALEASSAAAIALPNSTAMDLGGHAASGSAPAPVAKGVDMGMCIGGLGAVGGSVPTAVRSGEMPATVGPSQQPGFAHGALSNSEAAHSAMHAVSPLITDDAFLDGLLTELAGAGAMGDGEELMLPDFLPR